jgi:type IV secretion system protein VirB4
LSKNSKSSEKFYNDSAEYISVCSHYDANTLLTKNGELIQTIQINGLNQENVSGKLVGLRDIIRSCLKEHLNDPNIACWVHTIRRKVSLDDPTKYSTLLSQNIHDLWVKKNYWNDKYINTLFISFVHRGADLSVKDSNSILDFFNINRLKSKHEIALNNSRENLEKVVAPIAKALSDFGSKRLGIIYKDDDAYCEILTLLHGILRGTEEPIEICDKDLSKKVGSFGYAVGSNKIEVISHDSRKYAAVISLKEYQELSSKALDRMLQQPTEFVITEVFYFSDKKETKKNIDYQTYIAKVSNDSDLLVSKGISKMLDNERKYKYPFCKQQISILILNESIEQLDKSCYSLSFQLSRLGLAHVREDINVENSFWAQIPGNFKYLKRLRASCLDLTAAMASLHNFPAGSHQNPWGRANTILRTERGTPYFFNFHDEKINSNCFIIGTAKSGKTVCLNFFISESLKFNPSVLIVSFTNDSSVFIKSNYGKWFSNPFKIDPFKVKYISSNPLMITEILEAMCGKLKDDYTDEVQAQVKLLIDYFLGLPESERSIAKLSMFEFEKNNATSLKDRLTPYLQGGEYYNYFEESELPEISMINGICFSEFSDSEFAKKNYPTEDRFLPEYKKKYSEFTVFREILFITNLIYFREKFGSNRQIFKTENYNNFSASKFSSSFYDEYYKIFNDQNIVYLNSLKFSPDDMFFDSELWKNMQTMFGTKLYLSAESVTQTWKDKLYLSENEYNKLKSIAPVSRLFLVKQDDLAITCELSLGVFVGILKILSSEQNIIDECEKYILSKGDNPENWLVEFYDSIR